MTKIFYDLVYSPEDGWYAEVYQFDIARQRAVAGSHKDLHTTDYYPSRERAVAVVKSSWPTASLVNVS